MMSNNVDTRLRGNDTRVKVMHTPHINDWWLSRDRVQIVHQVKFIYQLPDPV